MVDYKYKYKKYKHKYLMEAGKYIQIHVSEPWFTLIFKGEKTIEGRPNKGIFAVLKNGQKMIFFNKEHNKQFIVQIQKINKYNTFEEMLLEEGLENVLPNVFTIVDGVNVYRQWYSEEIEKQYGIVGIKIEVISKDLDDYTNKELI